MKAFKTFPQLITSAAAPPPPPLRPPPAAGRGPELQVAPVGRTGAEARPLGARNYKFPSPPAHWDTSDPSKSVAWEFGWRTMPTGESAPLPPAALRIRGATVRAHTQTHTRTHTQRRRNAPGLGGGGEEMKARSTPRTPQPVRRGEPGAPDWARRRAGGTGRVAEGNLGRFHSMAVSRRVLKLGAA